MTHPKISIIIPVYNAESRLQNCIESAIKQSLSDIEIICVDDHSTDSSAEILSLHSSHDNRVKIVRHDVNKGAAEARNTGIEHATGEYIFFLDADDSIALDALKKLYTEARNNMSDMVKGGYDVLLNGKVAETNIWSTPSQRTANTNILDSDFLQKIPTSHTCYLYSHVFLNKHNIRYRTDLVVGEDLVTLATALVHAKNVTLIPDIVYHYHQIETSLTRGDLSYTIARDAIKSRTTINNLLNTNGLYDAATLRLKNWDFIITTYWLRMPFSLSSKECTRVFSEFRALISGNNITPWNTNTPHHYKYILALVLARNDELALSFLGKNEATDGFSDQEQLKKSLRFILTQVPDDIDTLMELGQIAISENNMNEAKKLFEEVIRYDDSYLEAQLQIASILQRAGRYDKSRKKLDIALQTLLRNIQPHKNINKVIKAKDDLNKEKHYIVVKELNTIQKELKAIRNSFSWKLTAPLRKIKNVSKKMANKLRPKQ